LFLFLLFSSADVKAQQLVRAGLRSSTYGINPFPDTTWWFNAVSDMASRFAGASPSAIWILGYTTNDGCYLGFPNPNPKIVYDKIYFSDTDENKTYLDAFDNNGVKVWLQIEPGFADIETVIDLVFTHYGHHKCIIGLGVDAEWYKTSDANDNEGEAVTDAEAEAWSAKLKSYNKDYLLFTKHWLQSKMPPTFRTDMVFVDDSQIFSDMNSMVKEFTEWADAFAPAKVAFQFGYDDDKKWWSKLANPPKQIGDAILCKCSNVSDLYWVDFNAYAIWPEDFNPSSVSSEKILPSDFILHPNYPNPFNPTTTVSFTLDKMGPVKLDVFNSLGQKIKNIIDNSVLSSGSYEQRLDLSGQSSGIYFLVLTQGNQLQVQKMNLLK
jgi:hypothetical protein